jgi:TPR repeat protein
MTGVRFLLSLTCLIALVNLWAPATTLFALGAHGAFLGPAPGQTGGDAASEREIEQLLRSASGGDRNAQFALGVRYDTGRGVLQDFVAAAKWFERAARQGVLEAEFSLAMAYALGRGVTQDDAQALGWFRQAGDRGLAKAQHMVGLAYVAGRGVDRDVLRGIDWSRKASDQGYAPAQFAIAQTFHPRGDGAMDAAGSVDLLRKAAAQEYPPAQLSLGESLIRTNDLTLAAPEHADAVMRDYVDAHMWFDICARHGVTEEELRLDSWVTFGVFSSTTACSAARHDVEKSMTPEQIADAQGRALDWLSAAERQRR